MLMGLCDGACSSRWKEHRKGHGLCLDSLAHFLLSNNRGGRTHRHIHNVSSGLRARQHGGHAGAGRVMRVHVNGHVRETVPQSADEQLAGLGLEQAGHILEYKDIQKPPW